MTESQAKKKHGPMMLVLGIVFLDIVGFSILFPLYPAMLEHYVGQEGAASLVGKLAQKLAEFSGDDPIRVNVLFGGLLGSLYSVLQFVFSPIWGGLSDRIGRRPTLLVTLTGTLVGYVLWVFAGSFWVLLVSRLLCGLMAGNISTASAVIADITPGKDRAKGMALLGATIGLGFIFGPVIGGGLWSVMDPGAVWGSGLAWNPFSIPALAAVLLATVNLLGVLVRFPETLDPQSRGSSAHARVMNPLAQTKRLKIPGVARTNLVYLLAFSAFGAAEFTLTFFAEDRLGYSPRDIVWIFVYSGLLITIVQGGFVRRLAPKYGEKHLAIAGLVTFLPGLILVARSHTATGLYSGLTFLSIASALVVPTLSSLASRYTPPDRQGLALGTFRSMGALARAVGPLFGGILYWRLGSGAPFYIGAGLIVIPLMIAIGLPPVPDDGSDKSAEKRPDDQNDSATAET